MNIGLIDVDGHHFPNLALMKISRYWKNEGANVEWYTPFEHYDVVYLSKVFTFTPDYGLCITNADRIERGGTGYKMYEKNLPENIDKLQLDYSLYHVDDKSAYGFLTRGCLRNCRWCIVPKKEGKIRPYNDIEEIAIEGRTNITLMDNNVLASDFGLAQIEKIIKMKLRVDFNQDLDCRLVTDDIAKMLTKVRWQEYIRFACDTSAQLPYLFEACDKLVKYGYKGRVFMNVLLNDDIHECLDRLKTIRSYNKLTLEPFAQPFLDYEGRVSPPQWQKDMARWVNAKRIFFTSEFEDYQPRKNFKCKEYMR